MPELRYSLEAARQIRSIRERRRRQAGVASSRRLREAFDRLFRMLRDFPRVGTVIHRVGDDEFRQFPVEGFVVRFRVFPSGNVLIVDVRHGSMRELPPDVLEQQAFPPEGDPS